ncbi:single-strand binding protein [Desulforamulus reducens MI-1]|uniref:Single-stranded DNA-binding protein n=1 Tax=Desulforamulus reducens (strain ATCC BAA-1160 / DSM 100696 / MI-1) TaxID=349161 RepID=A4J7S4_DESRM|nr:single-stranded DNA-binding protein [Desulforamulus reducens]ABO51127.1 single-strand binding protein [Desulforamulus reducens MI-1]
MNSVNIIGRLTRDPELRYTQNGKAVTNMSIAVQRYGNKDEADFFDCTAFEKTAETIANNLTKGREVGVSGRLQQERWDDQQTGQKRSAVKIMVNSITFIGPKQDNQQQSPNQPPAQQQQYQGPPQGYQQQGFQQPPGYIPPSQGGYPLPQGYPGQMPPQGPPPGQYSQQPGQYQQQPPGYQQTPAGPPNGQPPQGQIDFQFQGQGQGQQPPANGFQGNIDDIPF